MTRTLIYQCANCRSYTLNTTCPACKVPTKNPLPPKFSPEDAYGVYRRKLKKLARGGA